jgi:hypothetical protein
VTELPTFNGEPSTPDHGHIGWPVDEADVLHRASKGLPCYWPTDPSTVNQAPYIAFAALRGPNSE